MTTAISTLGTMEGQAIPTPLLGAIEQQLHRRRWKIVVDSTLLVGFLAEFVTREGPNYTAHSWIGIVLVPAIAVHLTGNWSWVKRVRSRGRQDREFSLGVLNAVLGMLAAICIITGFPIWLNWSTAEVLVSAHTLTGMASILLMFVHLWRNRRRITQLLGRGQKRTVGVVR